MAIGMPSDTSGGCGESLAKQDAPPPLVPAVNNAASGLPLHVSGTPPKVPADKNTYRYYMTGANEWTLQVKTANGWKRATE